jgi:hypothetical protein
MTTPSRNLAESLTRSRVVRAVQRSIVPICCSDVLRESPRHHCNGKPPQQDIDLTSVCYFEGDMAHCRDAGIRSSFQIVHCTRRCHLQQRSIRTTNAVPALCQYTRAHAGSWEVMSRRKRSCSPSGAEGEPESHASKRTKHIDSRGVTGEHRKFHHMQCQERSRLSVAALSCNVPASPQCVSQDQAICSADCTLSRHVACGMWSTVSSVNAIALAWCDVAVDWLRHQKDSLHCR